MQRTSHYVRRPLTRDVGRKYMKNTDTHHSVPFKSPYSSPINDVIACVLTIAIALAVFPLKDAKDASLYYLINNRGPTQWFILYLIIRNISATVMARRIPFLPDLYFRQSFAFALFPFLIGFIGTVQGLGAALGGFGNFLASGNADQMKNAVVEIFKGIGISLDTLYLGLLGTIICIGLYVQALAGRIKHNCVSSPQPPNDGSNA